LAFLKQYNHNFIRLWTWDQTQWLRYSDSLLRDATVYVTPFPWVRVGPGTARDGKPKFDLNQFDQAYFNRLRQRVIDAGARGIYVSIMLFEGNVPASVPTAVAGSPFNANNNVNGIHVDQNGDGKATEAYTLEIPGITAIQDAYVRKVIDTVNDLDNVLYEICNECPADSTGWQYRLIDLIKSYQAGKPKQHPVGMTIQIGGSVDVLYRSSADWISPNSEPSYDYLTEPKPGDGGKVILLDSDHITYFAAYAGMIWRQFTRGLNPLFMDLAPPLRDKSPLPEQDAIRKAMGYTSMFANKMNLAAMTPRGDLTSTGYALANPGSEYLVYAPSGGSFTVNLASGGYFFEWVNPSNGTIISSGSFSAASGDRSFTAPFSGDAVLYIKAKTLLHRLVP
jgi:Family of unknown function (DUF6298)/Putative collagen-binding domain of a collagenase